MQDKELCKENIAILSLLDTVRRLRGEGGCPWDRAQTHESLRRYLIEETYEVIEAIDLGDASAMREELGDLLLQILFHAEIEREKGGFSFADVAQDENEKMIRRHPHVFSDASAAETLSSWESNKSKEKARLTLADRLSSIPRVLPALLRAQKMLEKCEGMGVSPLAAHASRIAQIGELLSTQGGADPIRSAGDFLLCTIEAIRAVGVDCEAALTLASERILADAGNGKIV